MGRGSGGGRHSFFGRGSNALYQSGRTATEQQFNRVMQNLRGVPGVSQGVRRMSDGTFGIHFDADRANRRRIMSAVNRGLRQ